MKSGNTTVTVKKVLSAVLILFGITLTSVMYFNDYRFKPHEFLALTLGAGMALGVGILLGDTEE